MSENRPARFRKHNFYEVNLIAKLRVKTERAGCIRDEITGKGNKF